MEEITQQGRPGSAPMIKNLVIGVFADYNSTSNSSVPLMHVRMGLTDDTAAAVRQARPTILGECQNPVVEGEIFVQREFKTPVLATLGVFPVSLVLHLGLLLLNFIL